MSTIQSLASEMSHAFETRSTPDGDQRFLKEGSPEWMRDVVLAPDNKTDFQTLYEMVERCVDAIADSEDRDDAQDRIREIEADVYTADLTAWLARSVEHVYYVSETLDEFGGDLRDGFQLLAYAQCKQINEIGDAVLAKLEELAGEEPEEEEDTEEDDDVLGIDELIAIGMEFELYQGMVYIPNAPYLTPSFIFIDQYNNDYWWANDPNQYSHE